MENKTIKLSGKKRVIEFGAEVPSWVFLVEALLAVPEVRKAAANWASDELLAVREAIQYARNHE